MAAAYDDYDYPAYWGKRAYEHLSEVHAIETFFKKIGKDKNVLEIGAGYGRLTKSYDRFSKNITLVDPSPDLLAKAKSYLKDNKNISYIRSTIQNLADKLHGRKFDVIILVRVMHHIEDPGEAIKTAHEYLKPGGYFILEFANKIHGKAIFQNLLNGNFTFPLDIFPLDKRSKKNIQKHTILFLNHHPDIVEKCINDSGFKIVDKISVSNIRSKKIKSLVPAKILVKIDKLIQKPLTKINFGPSIFVLAQKK